MWWILCAIGADNIPFKQKVIWYALYKIKYLLCCSGRNAHIHLRPSGHKVLIIFLVEMKTMEIFSFFLLTKIGSNRMTKW